MLLRHIPHLVWTLSTYANTCLNFLGVSRFFGGRRLRPLLTKKHKDLRFAFDHVFDETSTQTEVFHHTTHSIIDGVLDGINCSVFAYGATGELLHAGPGYCIL